MLSLCRAHAELQPGSPSPAPPEPAEPFEPRLWAAIIPRLPDHRHRTTHPPAAAQHPPWRGRDLPPQLGPSKPSWVPGPEQGARGCWGGNANGMEFLNFSPSSQGCCAQH